MKPLRVRRYRSIGFVAHSLGGNVVSTYIHTVKSELGHPQRSQHAYVITLATPMFGSQMADLGIEIKHALGVRNDDLLRSLTDDNLYLRMLANFSSGDDRKGGRYGCRPVDLYAASEIKRMGPFLVVSARSAADLVKQRLASPPEPFMLNHSEMAKPTGPDDPLYKWVLQSITSELERLEHWHEFMSLSAEYDLCERIPFIPEDVFPFDREGAG
jgi:hypothetical protein